MNWPEFMVTYAISWWMVLFMILPRGVTLAQKPLPGHAPSAPEAPNLRKKFRQTTLWALLPAIAFYLLISAAYAQDVMYHAGGGCGSLNAYSANADILAKDGVGVGGKKLKPASLGESVQIPTDKVNIPLWIPSEKYIDPAGSPAGRNVDLSNSFLRMGDVSVSQDGSVTMNGNQIGTQNSPLDGCAPVQQNPAAPPQQTPENPTPSQ